MDAKDLIKGELIGKQVSVLEKKSRKETQKGTIINETKNLIIIEGDNGKIKKIIKSNFIFCFEDSKLRINGEAITSRPEDRIKSKVKNEKKIQ